MTNRISKWLNEKKDSRGNVELEDVTPQHPNDYPARHLKEILDERRAQSDAVASHPTGMLDGPGPLT